MTLSPNSSDVLQQLRDFIDPYDPEAASRSCAEQLTERILVLSDYAWEGRINQASVDRWLANFDGRSGFTIEQERLHATYILSQFLYFGVREIRVLLKALYRDLFLVPLIAEVRAKHGQTRDEIFIEAEVEKAIAKTRFLGVGNPSESGVHLLYYFRQENGLGKASFLDTAQIFHLEAGTRVVSDTTIERYIFVDDVCGSGDTAKKYSKNFLTNLKAQVPTAKIAYYCMFATERGLGEVRQNTVFGDDAKAVFELDESYRSLSTASRYLKSCPPEIDGGTLVAIATCYGDLLLPGNAGGFEEGQLLLGFSHNIPDNTLPIIWCDPANGAQISWTAAMRRYKKV